ncbi:hypothetical protein [Furfurilactobacillus siliginis]|uniref:hypothetical protein n=1 Tax=Furfurilactobacillus siliginis TaxID=348151 RepID=UPI001649F350|nr:hypothetical protein [Furfurilactobacillus siliginis]
MSYFIRGQFEFERPRRYKYWLIPLYSVFMFFQLFKNTPANITVAGVMVILGIAIGVTQGRLAVIKPTLNNDGQERVMIRGGWHYLIGWAAILVIQIGVTIVLAHHQMDWHELRSVTNDSMLEELLPFKRIHEGGWWVLWALSASASLSYTLTLMQRSPAFRTTISRHRHEQRAHRR